MTPTDVIRAARKLIADPIHHTRGSYARDVGGQSRSSNSEQAVCWCIRGAIAKIAWEGEPAWGLALGRCQAAARHLFPAAQWQIEGRDPLIYINDVLGHAAVLKILDRALEEL